MPPTINLLPQSYKSTLKRKRLIKNTSLYSALLIIPVLASLYLVASEPAAPITPLANSDQPEIVRQSLSDHKEPLAYYLSAAQKYLDQARAISRQTASHQTSSDKQKIISFLNESLRSANNAVKYYPDNSESYTQRAKVLRTLAVIDPSASDQAESDEKIASDLGSTGNIPHINPEDLILYQPVQEASISDNVIIALPEDETIAEIDTNTDVNATKGTAILLAGETTVTVVSSHVTNDNLVYFTPDKDTQNEILSLSSKSESEQKFTLKLTSPLPYDLPITWWIVK